MAKVAPAQGEVIIEHPEVEGAIMRIPAPAFDPAKHRAWDLDVEPWVEASGEAIPGAKARNVKGAKKSSSKTAEDEE